MSGKLLLIHGTITEVKSDDFWGAQGRVKELSDLLRESLTMISDQGWHQRVYAALKEEPVLLNLRGESMRLIESK